MRPLCARGRRQRAGGRAPPAPTVETTGLCQPGGEPEHGWGLAVCWAAVGTGRVAARRPRSPHLCSGSLRVLRGRELNVGVWVACVRGPWGLVLDLAPFPSFPSLWCLTLVPVQRAGVQGTPGGTERVSPESSGAPGPLTAQSGTASLRPSVCVCVLGRAVKYTQEHTDVHMHWTRRSASPVGVRGRLVDPRPLRAAWSPGLRRDCSLWSRFVWGVHLMESLFFNSCVLP